MVLGSVVQLLLHSGILGREISENSVALASTLLPFTVFLPVIGLGEVEEHNPFSESVMETGRHENSCKHFWSCCCHRKWARTFPKVKIGRQDLWEGHLFMTLSGVESLSSQSTEFSTEPSNLESSSYHLLRCHFLGWMPIAIWHWINTDFHWINTDFQISYVLIPALLAKWKVQAFNIQSS